MHHGHHSLSKLGCLGALQNLRERDQLVMAGGASLACWPVRAQSADRRCSEQGASARELLNLQCLLERSNWALYDRDCGEEYLADVDELWQSQPGYVPSPPASPAKLALPALVGGELPACNRGSLSSIAPLEQAQVALSSGLRWGPAKPPCEWSGCIRASVAARLNIQGTLASLSWRWMHCHDCCTMLVFGVVLMPM